MQEVASLRPIGTWLSTEDVVAHAVWDFAVRPSIKLLVLVLVVVTVVSVAAWFLLRFVDLSPFCVICFELCFG